MGLDDRIGPKFLQPGPGYGGSCFPKDIAALRHLGESVGAPLRILSAASTVNEQRQQLPIRMLKSSLGDLAGKTVAIWGLAFKPGTDDIRDAPAIGVIDSCLKAGATVVAFDPLVRDAAVLKFPALRLAPSALAALEGADALVVMTDWPEFTEYSAAQLRSCLRSPVVVDLRFVLKP
jgi:UDPglucose 6-dehydrogenase